MLTLKIKPYTNFEVAALRKTLAQDLEELQKHFCVKVCEGCHIRHLCIDLQSATLFAEDVVCERRDKENH